MYSEADMAHKLAALNACTEAAEWALAQPDMQAAWDNCQRGEWMLWWAANFVDRRSLVLAACDCAELVTDYADSAMQMLIVWMIETARMWARGEGGIAHADVLAAAADINTAAARAAETAAAGWLEGASPRAVHAAAVAVTVAVARTFGITDVGACAVHAAAAAAGGDADTNIWSETLSICADICREHWPLVPAEQGEE